MLFRFFLWPKLQVRICHITFFLFIEYFSFLSWEYNWMDKEIDVKHKVKLMQMSQKMSKKTIKTPTHVQIQSLQKPMQFLNEQQFWLATCVRNAGWNVWKRVHISFRTKKSTENDLWTIRIQYLYIKSKFRMVLCAFRMNVSNP